MLCVLLAFTALPVSLYPDTLGPTFALSLEMQTLSDSRRVSLDRESLPEPKPS